MIKDCTVIIVTFKSEKVINQCLKNLTNFKEVMILDNSKDFNLENNLKKKFHNVRFINAKYNLGYSRGHNFLMRLVKTKYVLLVSPDVIFNISEVDKIFDVIKKIGDNFSILAPYDNKTSKTNYGFYSKNKNTKDLNVFECEYVHGYFMFMNLKKILKVGLFDKNFFLYNEDLDLCNRLKKLNEKIFIIKDLQIEHLSATSSDIGAEYLKCKNWHWLWSKFYYEKKINGDLLAFLKYFPILLKLTFKICFHYFFYRKYFTKNFMRFKGLSTSMLGKKSSYRPTVS